MTDTFAITPWHYAPADPYRRLALAIVLQGLEDWKKGDLTAGAWLCSTAPDWLEAVGVSMPPDTWRKWVLAGCPGRGKRKKSGNTVRRKTHEKTPQGVARHHTKRAG